MQWHWWLAGWLLWGAFGTSIELYMATKKSGTIALTQMILAPLLACGGLITLFVILLLEFGDVILWRRKDGE